MTDPPPRSAPSDARLEQIAAAAAEDPVVAGVLLHGSRSIAGFARTASDYDLFVIVDGYGVSLGPWATTPDFDVMTIALADWPAHAMPGHPQTWNRHALVHAVLVYERAHSGVGGELERKRRLSVEEAPVLAAAALDEYINNCYRSLKNARDGRRLEAALDAAESVPPLLTALFALEGRVRPYNRHLMWELDYEPLALEALTAERLVTHLRMLIEGGDPVKQRTLVAEVAELARQRGHGERIDGWKEHFAELDAQTARAHGVGADASAHH